MSIEKNESLRKLLILGAGGHGRVVADIALALDLWSDISFLDDDLSIHNYTNISVIGNIDEAESYIASHDIFVAIGDNLTRRSIIEELEQKGAIIPVLIHPNSQISHTVEIDKGSVIMPGVVINSCTTIGKGCIINTSSSVDHDNKIGDYVHISPGAHLGGTVIIGNNTWIGIGAIVKNNTNIMDNCIIGAGAVVVKDIEEQGIYTGIPATIHKKAI